MVALWPPEGGLWYGLTPESGRLTFVRPATVARRPSLALRGAWRGDGAPADSGALHRLAAARLRGCCHGPHQDERVAVGRAREGRLALEGRSRQDLLRAGRRVRPHARHRARPRAARRGGGGSKGARGAVPAVGLGRAALLARRQGGRGVARGRRRGARRPAVSRPAGAIEAGAAVRGACREGTTPPPRLTRAAAAAQVLLSTCGAMYWTLNAVQPHVWSLSAGGAPLDETWRLVAARLPPFRSVHEAAVVLDALPPELLRAMLRLVGWVDESDAPTSCGPTSPSGSRSSRATWPAKTTWGASSGSTSPPTLPQGALRARGRQRRRAAGGRSSPRRGCPPRRRCRCASCCPF